MEATPRSFKELNPALAREPRLVNYDDREKNVYAPDSFSGYLFLVLSFVFFHDVRRLLKHWDEADVFVRRRYGDGLYAKVSKSHAVSRRSFGYSGNTSSFYVVDPSEVTTLNQESIAWSRGKPESITGFPTATLAVVEAHHVIGELCCLQRVKRFADNDGDHAIGERVVRFLVHPDFLLRDDDDKSDDSFEDAMEMARERVAEDASGDEEMGSDEDEEDWYDPMDE